MTVLERPGGNAVACEPRAVLDAVEHDGLLERRRARAKAHDAGAATS
jgi:hypothetical protein